MSKKYKKKNREVRNASSAKEITVSGPTMIRGAKNRSRRLRLAHPESYGIGRAAVYQ